VIQRDRPSSGTAEGFEGHSTAGGVDVSSNLSLEEAFDQPASSRCPTSSGRAPVPDRIGQIGAGVPRRAELLAVKEAGRRRSSGKSAWAS
jgi:hypothetical protein